jgi:hypothetical protein
MAQVQSPLGSQNRVRNVSALAIVRSMTELERDRCKKGAVTELCRLSGADTSLIGLSAKGAGRFERLRK